MTELHQGHGHGHGHVQDEPQRGLVGRLWASLRHIFTPHSHDAADRVDEALEGSRRGMRALWVSLLVLGATAGFQAVVVVLSGSVALLSDTLHNVADALTAVPVGIAFLLGRRAATRRFTYGFGRAEDVAGVVVVLIIAASAVAAGVESVRRLADPTGIENVWVVAVAALVGFAGNEIAARVRIYTGRKIGSAALVADGLHARTDALTSLAVLLAAGGAGVGWRWADPVVGLAITVMIAMVTWTAAKHILARLMDAVDPVLVDHAETSLRAMPEVAAVERVRLRWIGHTLHGEVDLTVADGLSLRGAHDIAHEAEHRLRHAVPRLSTATVHAYPGRSAGCSPPARAAEDDDIDAG